MITVKARVTPASARRILLETAGLRRFSAEALTETVTELTVATHAYAVRGIQRGPKSGRVYRKSRPNRTHRASAPGEYPASDTGRLASSVRLEIPTSVTGNPIGQVYTNLRYGVFLELGTSRMAARPWLLRSFTKATKYVTAKLNARFNRRRR